MVAGIVAFLQLLPRIMDLAGRLGNWMTQNNIEGWIDGLEKHVDALEKAKTTDDKFNAAKGLTDSIRNLS